MLKITRINIAVHLGVTAFEKLGREVIQNVAFVLEEKKVDR